MTEANRFFSSKKYPRSQNKIFRVSTPQYTVALIKPDAVRAGYINNIQAIIENAGLVIKFAKPFHLTIYQASEFYIKHEGHDYFKKNVLFMSSGPLIAMILYGINSIERYRILMGNTDPEVAALGTLRREFATGLPENAVHGSDSPESAVKEMVHILNWR